MSSLQFLEQFQAQAIELSCRRTATLTVAIAAVKWRLSLLSATASTRITTTIIDGPSHMRALTQTRIYADIVQGYS